MEFVDSYLRKATSANVHAIPRNSTVDAARLFSQSSADIDTLLAKFSRLSFVEKRLLQGIFEYDHIVDSLPQADRLHALQEWRRNADLIAADSSEQQRVFLRACIDSEIELAAGELGMEAVMYFRARSFAYTMLYIVKERLLPLFLLGNMGLEYTCDFAIAAVIHDDAEDAHNDSRAGSPTIFTVSEEAPAYALSMLAQLETKSYASLLNGVLASLGVVDIKPLILLGIAKTHEFQGLCARTPCVDIVRALQNIQ